MMYKRGHRYNPEVKRSERKNNFIVEHIQQALEDYWIKDDMRDTMFNIIHTKYFKEDED